MLVSGMNMTERERVSVLNFDEMSVRKLMEYDAGKDEIVGPHAHAQFVMVRGLFAKWKQVVYVAFDQPMTKAILFEIITKLHEIGYPVVAINSDNGPENLSLRKEVGVTDNHTFFNHPLTQDKVYVFGDSPHNLKLIRNWFIGDGIMWENKIINSRLVRVLIEERATCELTPLFMLTIAHVDMSSAEKQNVAKATKLLSHTTATMLKERFGGTKDAEEANLVAKFIQTCNDWFDIFNSFTKTAKVDLKRAFTGAQDQLQAIDAMLNLMTCIRGIQQGGAICKSLATFQRSIIMSIRSLKSLLNDLQCKYGIEYILTYKVVLKRKLLFVSYYFFFLIGFSSTKIC